ncbi:MAG: hypothetical protein FWG54_02515 [Bacteroidetes bacterium]|nr:hypothetical protein [Bacteroidota bacterium]
MKCMVKYVVLACIILLGSCGVTAQVKPTEHTVRWMENIYIIAKKYNLDPQIILDYNKLSAQQVKRGMVLLIPPQGIDRTLQQDSLVQREFVEVATPFNPNDCSNYLPYPGINHAVSLILPFQLSREEPDSRFLEFYQGLLLATEDLKQEGMGITLSSYDLAAYPNMHTLVQSGALQNEALILGPVYAQDLIALLQDTYGSEVKIVSPLDPQAEHVSETNPRFFQVNPSLYWQQYNLLQYLEPQLGEVWLFSEEGATGTDRELLLLTKQILTESSIPFREYSHKVLKDKNIANDIAPLFTPYTHNQVIVVSSNEGFVSDLLRNLYIVHSSQQRPITLFGNAVWRNFDNVDLDYYHQMHLHLSLSYYVDYERPELKKFLARYRALYQAEPSAYAYHGYDVGLFFLRALYTKGPHFEECIEYVHTQPLQSSFRFQKTNPFGGFINTDSRVIRYLPDYRIEVLH